MLALLDKGSGMVLDVGCGPGIMAKDLIHLGYEFWGMDASANVVEECNRRFQDIERAHFLKGSATNIEFPDEFFDMVICMGVIDRIKAFETAIGEMCRVLKPDGLFLIAFPNLKSPSAAWRAYVYYPTMTILRPIYYKMLGGSSPSALTALAKMHTENKAAALLNRNGCEVLDAVYYNFNVCLSPLDELFPKLTLKLTQRLESFNSGPFRWLGSGFILKARKAQ